jgi:hypothetical protein
MSLPGVAQRIDVDAVAKDLFGILGFADGSKYLPEGPEQEDPRIAQLMAELQKMQQFIQTEQYKIQGQLQVEQARSKASLTEAVIKTTADRQVKLTQMALDRGMKLKELETQAGVDSGKLNLDYLKELNRRMDADNQRRELEFKASTGRDGI